MWISFRKGIRKPTSRELALRRSESKDKDKWFLVSGVLDRVAKSSWLWSSKGEGFLSPIPTLPSKDLQRPLGIINFKTDQIIKLQKNIRQGRKDLRQLDQNKG